MKAISRASHTLLIRTITTAIPVCSKLPQGTLKELECLNRQFLWTDYSKKRTMHHVVEADVCKAKGGGGLGIRKLSDTKMVSLAKLCWRLLKSPHQLWSKLLMAMYGGLLDLQDIHRRVVTSHTWKGISRGWALLRKGIQWSLGSGKLIKFWIDCWLSDHPII